MTRKHPPRRCHSAPVAGGAPCWTVMETGGDRFKRVHPGTVTLGFIGKGIKDSAVVRHDFLAVGLVQRSLNWWAVASGDPVGFHPSCTVLGNPPTFPSPTRPRNGCKLRARVHVRAGAAGARKPQVWASAVQISGPASRALIPWGGAGPGCCTSTSTIWVAVNGVWLCFQKH